MKQIKHFPYLVETTKGFRCSLLSNFAATHPSNLISVGAIKLLISSDFSALRSDPFRRLLPLGDTETPSRRRQLTPESIATVGKDTRLFLG